MKRLESNLNKFRIRQLCNVYDIRVKNIVPVLGVTMLRQEDLGLTKAEAQAIVECYMLENI